MTKCIIDSATTSSLFIAIWFCTCDWSASEVNLGVRLSLMLPFISWFILLSSFQTCMDFLYCDHQSIGLIDSLAISLAPLFLTSILILGLIPQICALVLFELKIFFWYILCIYIAFSSAIYYVAYIFLFRHVYFPYDAFKTIYFHFYTSFGLQVIQKWAVGWIWPTGCNLTKSNLDI